MTDSLQVIALISGGKDSFFSLLHCLQNGHQVVALANLYPAPISAPAPRRPDAANHDGETEDEQDLNSFMYQTVGHTVIPLYEQALGIPLYRQQIVGGAVQTGTSYEFSGVSTGVKDRDVGSLIEGLDLKDSEEDETESLIPLLKRIIAAHPTANALSTGAILSTYQRTRIESVATRLGLTPLSYLWQYPVLPPSTQISLLQDMQSINLDARIVKVASGGLDETFLWENVASERVMRRVERAMKRFGTDGDGAVLGEGGEFETLVVDGPRELFKGRIVVEENDSRVVREGGGSAWLKIMDAKVLMKDEGKEGVGTKCRIPDLLEKRFSDILNSLFEVNKGDLSFSSRVSITKSTSTSPKVLTQKEKLNSILRWTITAKQSDPNESISTQASKAIEHMRRRLREASLQPIDIISTVIILRSMQDFASINKAYGSLFTAPNPPSRVTISCGTLLPPGISMIIHLAISPSSTPRKALYVQSRSYWAPANIGPYSQAISIALPTSSSDIPLGLVSIAGQIPLIPYTMNPPLPNLSAASPDQQNDKGAEDFKFQVILSLQHLIRITREMHVSWLTTCVAYLPSHSSLAPSAPSSPSTLTPSQKSHILSQAWRHLHQPPARHDTTDNSDSDTESVTQARDLWEEKHYAGMEVRGAVSDERAYPGWDIVDTTAVKGEDATPPFWTVEVEELPRGSMVEWGAGVGIVGNSRGGVKLNDVRGGEGWMVHQCVIHGSSISVVMLDYTTSLPSILSSLESALSSLGLERRAQKESTAAYVDVSIDGLWEEGDFPGGVPCRGMWDSEGRRMACVLVFEGF